MGRKSRDPVPDRVAGPHVAQRLTVELSRDGGCVHIAAPGGFEMTVPLAQIQRFGSEHGETDAIHVSVQVALADQTGNPLFVLDESIEWPDRLRPGPSAGLPTEGAWSTRADLPAEPHEPVRPAYALRPPDPPGPDPHAPDPIAWDPDGRAERAPDPHAWDRDVPPEQPAPALPPGRPFERIKGPDLSTAAADSQDWLVLWPLGDTVALSPGDLLVPPERP
jgi:hypothetical protein